MWKSTKLLSQRIGPTQFLTFMQRTLRFLLNCVSHGEPDCAYWWGTGHSQRNGCYVAKLLLEPLRYKCKEKKTYIYIHISTSPYTLNVSIPPTYLPACTRVMLIGLKSRHLDHFPSAEYSWAPAFCQNPWDHQHDAATGMYMCFF